VIFSRSRGSGRHAKDDEAGASGREPDTGADEGTDEVEETLTAAERGIGPYDVTEAPAGIQQLDLGALLVPAVEGVEVRIQADNEGRIQQVVLVADENALMLGAFAAPKTEPIWPEVREEIRKSLFNDGVAAEEVDGVYGKELRARVRGPEGLTDIRFVGVDGPRWFVRATYQGPAAIDPSVAPALGECLANLVVDRGQEAMPVREPLPLRLPKEITDQQQAEADAAATAAGDGDDGANGSGTTGSGGGSRRRPSPKPRRR
jgi:hypothetical protein